MTDFMSEKHFKNAAKRLRDEIEKSTVSPSHAQSLQTLSRILFDKPYEEVRETLLKKEQEKVKDETDSSVVILYMASDQILMVDGDYINGNFPGSDMEIGDDVLISTAESLASQKGVSVEYYTIPIRDIDEYETDNGIQRAFAMGIFDKEPSLFKMLIEPPSDEMVVFVNGGYCPYLLNGDWIDDVENEDTDVCIWSVDTFFDIDDGNFEKMEYFISFDNLCHARYIGNKKWTVPTVDENVIVSIKY